MTEPLQTVVEIPPATRYSVTVGSGLGAVRAAISADLRATEWSFGPRIVVTDTNVARFHLDAVMADFAPVVGVVLIPPGETHKRPDAVIDVVSQAARFGLDRRSAIIALGGGVIGDIAGLSAALFMRGIPFVAAPTTLLAMVDASVGGKTGVDLPEGKNLFGVFHHPFAVVADVETLHTLPDEEWQHGLAEIVKTGIIGAPELLDDLETIADLTALRAAPERVAEIVHRCVGVKAGIVMRDERELGERMQLNTGHTIAHALEAASHFTLPHGAAVAVGLVVEARLAHRLGLADSLAFADRIAAVLARFGISPSGPKNLAPVSHLIDAALPKLASDKKKQADRVRFALPVAVRDIQIVSDIPLDSIAAELRAVANSAD